MAGHFAFRERWIHDTGTVSETEDGSGRRAVVLWLVLALLLAGVDVLVLGLAVAFGPTGFGGDRTPSRSDEIRALVGQVAGAVGLVLAAAAFGAAVAVPAGRLRARVVVAAVVAQAGALAVLVGSTMA